VFGDSSALTRGGVQIGKPIGFCLFVSYKIVEMTCVEVSCRILTKVNFGVLMWITLNQGMEH
jgi:hypothetical protein